MDRYLPQLSDRGKRWARFLALLAVLALVAWIALVLRPVLTPLVAALALAYMLNPLVTLLEKKWGVKRVISISAGLGVLVLAGVALLAVGAAQLVQLAGNASTYVEGGLRWLDETVPGLLASPGDRPQGDAARQPSEESTAAFDPAATPASTVDSEPRLGEQTPGSAGRDRLIQLATEHGLSVGRTVIGYVARLVSNAFYWLSLTVLLPLYTFFFLLRFNEIVQSVHDHLPANYRPTIVRVVTTIDAALASFFRGRLLVCLVVGTLMGIGWGIVGVPYPLPLGALAGTLNLVPFLSVLALPPALLLTYLQAADANANWVAPVVLVLAVYLTIQAIESFVLTPVIESRTSGLHPITTVIALLIGGQLAGLLGMLLAIPIASTLKSLAAEYALPEMRRLADARETQAPQTPDMAPAASDVAQSKQPAATREPMTGDQPPEDE